METIKRFAGGTVSRRTGSEGPRHDPYSFVEYRVEGRLAGRRVSATYHSGLGEWTEFYRLVGNADRKFRFGDSDARAVFEAHIGVSVKALDRALEYVPRCCSKPRYRTQRGFPGETFEVCGNCGAVAGYSFDIGAVI
jgi:hypothetical protein